MAVGMKLRSGRVLKAYVPKKRRSNFKKAVQKIAKNTLVKASETKNRVLVGNGTFGINGFFTPIYTNVSQGADSVNRIGDKINALGVRFRGWIGTDPAIITTNKSFVAVRLLIVSGKRPLTSGDMPTFKGQIDPEILTVHYDRYINYTDTDQCKYINKWFPFKRTITYAGGTPTKNEMYVMMIPDARTGATTTTGFITDNNYQLYWKDL